MRSPLRAIQPREDGVERERRRQLLREAARKLTSDAHTRRRSGIPGSTPLQGGRSTGTGCAYFFDGSGYLRYNIATDFVDVGPAAIAQFWSDLLDEDGGDISAGCKGGRTWRMC